MPPSRGCGTKERRRQDERHDSGCARADDGGDGGAKSFPSERDRAEERKRGHDRFGHTARPDVVFHHLHRARDSGADAIQIDPRHRAKQDGKDPHHLGIESEPVPSKPHDKYGKARHERALHYREENREMKERPTATALASDFRPRNEGNDRVVEAKHPDFAQDIGRGPGDKKHP